MSSSSDSECASSDEELSISDLSSDNEDRQSDESGSGSEQNPSEDDESPNEDDNSSAEPSSEATPSSEERSDGSIPDFSDLEDLVNICVVADIHFRPGSFAEGEEFIEKCIAWLESRQPTIIIQLGDLIHTMEVAKQPAYEQACRFVEFCSKIAPTYVLMGNHDLINNSQFLTNKHFFNPLKKWPNVCIVDRPTHVNVGGYDLVMCPYVAQGRFIEALDTMLEYEDPVEWQLSDCVFAHVEIDGVLKQQSHSGKKDVWDEAYPPLVSGHIHKACKLGPNVYYPGSAMQVAIDEDPEKRVWQISFDPDDGIQIEKTDLELRARKEVHIDYADLSKFDFNLPLRYNIKLKISGTSEQFKLFRKSQLHAKMSRAGVSFGYDPINDDSAILLDLKTAGKDDTSFEGILRALIKQKPELVRTAYYELYGEDDDDEEYELHYESE